MEWKLSQAAVVVRDLDRAIEGYSSVLGIGPFRRYEVWLPKAEVRGKPCELRLKLALARLGEVSLELIQGEPGENIYWEFLQKQGEGLHHLGFDVKDLEAELGWLREKGIGVLQRGQGERVRFAYLDSTGIGGTILELIQRS